MVWSCGIQDWTSIDSLNSPFSSGCRNPRHQWNFFCLFNVYQNRWKQDPRPDSTKKKSVSTLISWLRAGRAYAILIKILSIKRNSQPNSKQSHSGQTRRSSHTYTRFEKKYSWQRFSHGFKRTSKHIKNSSSIQFMCKIV